MDRRHLLRLAGAGCGLLAGCLDERSDAPPSPTAPASDDTPSVTGTTFDAIETTCGSGDDAASVSVGPHVAVAGTIGGDDACHTAALAGAPYDPGRDRLTVRVRSYAPDASRACAQCLVDIDYEATVRFAGGLPGTVVVEHGGRRVRRVER
ncbi:MAG: hypothetical protein ABEJ23_04725 [Haloarculaceae archaeon]